MLIVVFATWFNTFRAIITLMRGEMAALGADMTASEIQYDLATLTESDSGSRSQ